MKKAHFNNLNDLHLICVIPQGIQCTWTNQQNKLDLKNMIKLILMNYSQKFTAHFPQAYADPSVVYSPSVHLLNML